MEQRIDLLNGSSQQFSDSPDLQKINPICPKYKNNPRMLVSNFRIHSDGNAAFAISLRIPAWADCGAVLTVNGEAADAALAPGSFVTLERVWKDDCIHLELNKRISVDHLPGAEDMVAFLDGPVVLAGLCDEERTLYTHGHPVEELLVADNEREWSNWMNTYKTRYQDRGIRFIPLYQVGYEPYAVYFPIEEG